MDYTYSCCSGRVEQGNLEDTIPVRAELQPNAIVINDVAVDWPTSACCPYVSEDKRRRRTGVICGTRV